jgi:RelE-like toxin of type II toxin-antitoxin system HigB
VGLKSRRERGCDGWMQPLVSPIWGAIRGNRLEALKSDRTGQYIIRINHRWRICFSWRKRNAHDVGIVDYY